MKDHIEVFSFDIFETVISRDGKKPFEIFELIQQKLESLIKGLPENFVNNFASIREECERKARESSSKEDITFNELYDYIGTKYNLNRTQTNRLKRIEFEVELNAIKPVQWVVSEIKSLRKKGKRIVFTTEMYLPKEYIIKMLQKVGVYQNCDEVYASGEIGLLKYTGNLFKYILDKEKCLPKHLCHFGDNVLVDMIIPHKLGINIYRTPIVKIKLEIFKRNAIMIKNRSLFIAAKVYRLFFPKK